MKECLDLDIGNSSIKWRVGTRQGVVPHGELPDINCEVERVRVSSVALERQELISRLRAKYGKSPEFAQSTQELGGVTNGYNIPKQLGVDRWLALVAAWNKFRTNVVVFDFGTAMTVDYVKQNGTHLGGFIVPSEKNMREVLGDRTRDVQVSETSEHSISFDPGTNTDTAVIRGLDFMCHTWVSGCISLGIERLGPDTLVVVTGRGTQKVKVFIDSHYMYEPSLVLDGLAIALP
ncbi:MAG: type III pantothenate kinase [Gammaproteobacteria bacterium]|nr:type III pantothenate kinase [Gammaproteobacteria bacterium]